jgi:uncharacterized membrane protein
VCFIFLFETVQTALTGADVYYWFMAGFGDRKSLDNARFSLIDIAVMGAIISLIVQLFFCYRIYTLNRRLWWLCTIIAVVSLISPTFRVNIHSSCQYKSYLLLKRPGASGTELR